MEEDEWQISPPLGNWKGEWKNVVNDTSVDVTSVAVSRKTTPARPELCLCMKITITSKDPRTVLVYLWKIAPVTR